MKIKCISDRFNRICLVTMMMKGEMLMSKPTNLEEMNLNLTLSLHLNVKENDRNLQPSLESPVKKGGHPVTALTLRIQRRTEANASLRRRKNIP